MASPDLNWLIVRNNNAYLLKKRNIKKPFSTVSSIIVSSTAHLHTFYDESMYHQDL